jgi:YaaC-like Protein
LAGLFRGVACNDQWQGRELLCFEQINPHHDPGGYPADEFQPVIAPIRNLIWAVVATAQPYRRYFVYLAPAAEHPFVMPQLLSIYAITYYLSSVTRYRPHHYDAIAAGKGRALWSRLGRRL